MRTSHLKEHIEKLSLFVAVARAGSFHGAAKILRLSQPTLSQSVQILESVLELKLLERSRKGITLTRAGTELLAFSERLFSEVEGVEKRLHFPDDPMAGDIHVGSYESLAIYLWPKFLSYMAKKYPNLSITLSTAQQNRLTDGLLSRGFHLIVSSEPEEHAIVEHQELYKDSFSFFYPSKIKDSSNTPLIYVPHAVDSKGQRLDQLLWQKKVVHKRIYNVDTFEAAKALALEGLGIAILPNQVASSAIKAGMLKKIQFKNLSEKIGEHRIMSSSLIDDRSDPRILKFSLELKNWCTKNQLKAFS